jgi:O-antigen/teichoic acid export membrane protein
MSLRNTKLENSDIAEVSQPRTVSRISTARSRVASGAGANAITQVISAGTAFVLVPLFLHAWGAAQYGRWLTLTSMVMYLMLFDLGGQSYFANLLASAYALEDREEFRKIFGQGISLFTAIVLLAFLFLLALVCLPPVHFFHQELAFSGQDRVVLFCMGIAFLLGVGGGILAAAYRASGLYSRGAMIGNINRGTTLLISAAILMGGAGPGVYAAFWMISNILLFIYQAWDVYRKVPSVHGSQFGLRAARLGLVHLSGSLFFWLLSISTALNQQGVLLVVAMSGSTTAVALFATHRTVCGLVNYISSFVQSPMMPELNYMYSRGEIDQLRRVSLLAMKVVTLTSTFAGICLWLVLPVVYPRWTGKSLALDLPLLAILLTQAVLAVGWQSSGWVLMASNRHRQISVAALINGVLTIGLGLVLASHWGTAGVAFASLIGDVLCGLALYPLLSASALGLRAWTLFLTILLPMLALTPLWIVAAIRHPAPAMTLGSTSLLMLLCVVMLLPAGIWGFHRREDTEWIRARLISRAR